MSRFTILLGGAMIATPRLRAQVAGTRVIAADSGIGHADALGLEPELWIGDFDSIPDGADRRFAHVRRETWPQDKDQTDGELAVDRALAEGATSLILAGAFGGPRTDHAFLHLGLGISLAERGIPSLLTSGDQEGAALSPGRTAFDLPPGTLFSILAFSDLSRLTIRGAKWPLEEVEVPFGSSLTLSNVAIGPLQVGLGTGRAILVADFRPALA